RIEIDQHLKHVPAMARVATRRQHHTVVRTEGIIVKAGQLQSPSVESIEPAQLIDADLRSHVGKIALGSWEHHIDLPCRVALDAMEAVLLQELRCRKIDRGDCPTLQG